ncbi:hypothetical protein [Loigolactobacillus bifermentans]|uniref:Uncharacterized protein n=1 Tax=Loigolactobacillus bifermentans DSM 20003 TaxID=1423726 RepID=A0A0R1GES0_9LACO|nr:hypothetical protein [Loigolactobacillus bifermentans]KRK32539.1 hypothetical protein FC07_GL001963 [Loigolactobacillus bifermentans DSM 20003]QGG60212.1 hypothetical protein LB003_06955 [Loigolactobacillus bifermentans]
MAEHAFTLAKLEDHAVYTAIMPFQVATEISANFNAFPGDRIRIVGKFPNGAFVYNLDDKAGFFVPTRRIAELFG